MRPTQDKRYYAAQTSRQTNVRKASISGCQAHSLHNAIRFGNEERRVVSLPKLKFMDKPDEED